MKPGYEARWEGCETWPTFHLERLSHKEFEKLYMGSFISAAPSWHETSLTWLEENHPEFLGGRGKPAERLVKALRKASYLLAESSMDPKVQSAAIVGRVEVWGQQQHDEMRDWFTKGGFVLPTKKPPPAMFKTPFGEETIEMVMPGEEETEAAEKAVSPPSQHKQSLDDAVERSILEQDERFGSW